MKNKNIKKPSLSLVDINNELKIDKAIVRLIKLVINMPQVEKRELLNKLEKTHPTKYTEKRAYPRERVFIYSTCRSHKHISADFIHNISRSGLLIGTEPQIPLLIGQRLSMAFNLPSTEDPVKFWGNIVRIDSKGVAIQFDAPTPYI
ncbi:MAG: PilZ domain-containing protein [Desulfobacterales bacterium]|nr:MAG: PilZ domain-containing protein [Desulfobacterales bacterium]